MTLSTRLVPCPKAKGGRWLDAYPEECDAIAAAGERCACDDIEELSAVVLPFLDSQP